MARLREVTIKIVAATAVILLRKVPAPREPKTVWLEPPKAAPISAPLPDCSRMTPTMTKATMICTIIKAMYILTLLGDSPDAENLSKQHRIEASTADQSSIHVRNREKLADVFRHDASPVEDRHQRPGILTPQGKQVCPHMSMHLVGLLASGGAARANRPHQLISNDHVLGLILPYAG